MTRTTTQPRLDGKPMQGGENHTLDRRHLLGLAAGIAVLASRRPHAVAQVNSSMPPGSVGITVEPLGSGQPKA